MPLSLDPALPPPRRTLALLVAPERRGAFHELTDCSAALPFAWGLRVIDFQLANLMRAGIGEVIVLQPGAGHSGLRNHIRQVWRPVFRRIACLGMNASIASDPGGINRFLALVEGVDPDDLLLLSADHVCETDLAGMLAFHQGERNLVTLGAHPEGDEEDGAATDPLKQWIAAINGGESAGIGMVALDWHWFRRWLAQLPEVPADLPRQAVTAAAREAGLQVHRTADAGRYWRRVDGLDAFRVTWLDFICGPRLPCSLPVPPDHVGMRVLEAGPRTNVRDSVIMPGASVGERAFVSRAIIAPGAHVPDGMVIGQDAAVDARLFRRAPGGTTLVTAEMLAAL
ncbi:hypothetical protein G5B31_11345 [Rhodobacter sp. SGA-6-6]|uniref:sugar phosphate nucleotidyltransferase n=1 Tax=Rhodobacter sp. SGA-6-6 TaxID=2710882 RepID=UPI0013EB6F21|nr:sugar phosphate nucleotidyltransferase [Rhodobacter sp. SGA-6-6]NGM46128.1 hypothetical protein [Rhodobacter sp. SGA-6-6]